MESPSKLKTIKQAIKQLMEETGNRGGGATKSSSDNDTDDDVDGDNRHHHRLLSKLMSQLESLDWEPEAHADELPFPTVSKLDSPSDDESAKVNNTESRFDKDEQKRIVKELNNLKRQNFITQCLLSVMIVLTIAWQISEVSIILKLKDGVSHPFRSIGSLFKGMVRPPKVNDNEEQTESLNTSNLIESSPIHDLKIPELPHVELPKIDWGSEDGR